MLVPIGLVAVPLGVIWAVEIGEIRYAGGPPSRVAGTAGSDLTVRLTYGIGGAEVLAVTLELWSDPANDGERSCCSADAVRAAHAVDPGGTLRALEHGDGPGAEAGALQVARGCCRLGRVVDDGGDRPVGIGDEAVG